MNIDQRVLWLGQRIQYFWLCKFDNTSILAFLLIFQLVFIDASQDIEFFESVSLQCLKIIRLVNRKESLVGKILIRLVVAVFFE